MSKTDFVRKNVITLVVTNYTESSESIKPQIIRRRRRKAWENVSERGTIDLYLLLIGWEGGVKLMSQSLSVA